MDKNLYNLVVLRQADIWLKENPLLLNSQEKQKFLVGLKEYLEDKDIALDDEVFDFLVQRKLVKNEPREVTFYKYLLKKYKTLKGVNVLDVGAGRICNLSKFIAENGGTVTSMDTVVRLSDDKLKKMNITAIKKLFKCDEFNRNGVGTDISDYDLIVGLEPCGATEHIIRQSLKYDKLFEISLCAAPHQSLSGEKFRTYREWYKHLSNISKEVLIIKNECGYVATNNDGLEM